MSAAEQKVRKLTRLPGNCVCANCGTQKKFGFSSVCIKFHTFVCNNCKSSHQAISHRCKSLTMSSWSDAEVAELQRKGNDYARRTWLKNAPPVGQGGRPREGDHVDVFKRFVVDVYERRRYYGEDNGAVAAAPHQVAVAVPVAAPVAQPTSGSFAVAPPQRAPAPKPRPRAPAPRPRAPAPKPPAPKPPAPAPVVDLLDFAAPAPQAAASGGNTDMFQANFDAFGSSSPATSFQANFGNSQTTQAPSSNSAFDANFANFQGTAAAPVASPAPAPTSSAFSFISPPPAAAPAPAAPSGGFADFSGMTVTEPAAPAPTSACETKKKSVMSNQSLSHKASLISSMDAISSGNQQQGFGGMQQNNFGMQQQPMNMMQHNMMAQQQMMMQQQQMHQQQMQQQQRMMQHNMNPGMGMGMNPGMNNTGMNPGMGNGMMHSNPMMNPQQMMHFGGTGMGKPNNNNNSNVMNSLQMNASSMNAWTSGENPNNSKNNF